MGLSVDKAFELAAYIFMWRDARRGEIEGISAKMFLGLAVSISLGVFNMPSHPSAFDVFSLFSLISVAWGCTYSVAKAGGVDADDGLLMKPLSRWVQTLVVFAAAAGFSLIAVFVACKCSFAQTAHWVRVYPVGLLCTFQNYLHGVALLPQLFLSQRHGCVAAPAARFLCIIGVKHIVEFIMDLVVSCRNFFDGSLQFNEVSFMSGDLFAAAILTDFLYLVLKSKAKTDKLHTFVNSLNLPLNLV